MTLSSLNCGARSRKKSRHFRIILWEFTCQVCANATSKKQKCKTNWQGYFSTRQTGETLCCCYSIEEGGRFQKLVSILHKDAFSFDVVRCTRAILTVQKVNNKRLNKLTGLLLHTTDKGNTMLLLFHRRRWEIPKTC